MTQSRFRRIGASVLAPKRMSETERNTIREIRSLAVDLLDADVHPKSDNVQRLEELAASLRDDDFDGQHTYRA
ncbi:hypothetical protein F8O06_05490 [Pseudoclavibacter sp. CFCC 14310]|uniref:hypothetical protein n=1 Tax=Pseudoclavibacter sp. CFCC 14310 TaxID=2615180 RepID=UPI001300F920|nr:hypothetical protein [Pseudoclavibacter sp. CFCC 14310]KAB1646218.1 hypothetical protein F8O06_05490 [Pseudoclavibacter sp. CFCC 14310]